MKNSRRNFLKRASIGIGVVGSGGILHASDTSGSNEGRLAIKPVVVSTWNHGLPANEAAWRYLINDKSALDAVEAGVRVPESDPNVRTVGLGGYPDRDGNVTLDACIMSHTGDCGSVAFLQHIENPVSVARKVMEKTPHIMLVGEGALQFALAQGFERKNLLTE